MTAEDTLGRWKGRFRRVLKRIDMAVRSACYLVAAACILHNICELRKDEFLEVFSLRMCIMLLNSLTTSHWQIRGKEMPPTFEMLLQYFSLHLRAEHLVVAVNKLNFFLIHHFQVGHNAPCLPSPPPPTNFA